MMADPIKPNPFTAIFEPLWEHDFKGHYTDRVVCVREELKNGDPFSAMDSDKLYFLPAFAAWIAEAIQPLAPTQLRRFYTYVKRIERTAKDENGVLDRQSQAKLMFLLPKLAGNANVKKNEEKESLKILYDLFSICIIEGKKIQSRQDVEQFVEFFEAILDYHATFDSKSSASGGNSHAGTND